MTNAKRMLGLWGVLILTLWAVGCKKEEIQTTGEEHTISLDGKWEEAQQRGLITKDGDIWLSSQPVPSIIYSSAIQATRQGNTLPPSKYIIIQQGQVIALGGGGWNNIQGADISHQRGNLFFIKFMEHLYTDIVIPHTRPCIVKNDTLYLSSTESALSAEYKNNVCLGRIGNIVNELKKSTSLPDNDSSKLSSEKIQALKDEVKTLTKIRESSEVYQIDNIFIKMK